jgi:phosphopentomutase
MPPPEPTLLDRLTAAGREVRSIGKIGDIFAGRGTGAVIKASGHDALFERTVEAASELAAGGLAFVNFVDFDSLYGHRRDVAGYAAALEHFDRRLPELFAHLRPDDVAILTADHGCDPTWTGSDHTRECVPVLAYGPNLEPGPIGRRSSFADIGQTVAALLGLAPLAHGTAWPM